jgi:hypothetical protein
MILSNICTRLWVCAVATWDDRWKLTGMSLKECDHQLNEGKTRRYYFDEG